MTINIPKANTSFPDPTRDDGKFADQICTQIHSLVLQLHQHGKLGPERISDQLWDLVTAVKRIAIQYSVNYLSCSPSAADRTNNDRCSHHIPASSNSPFSGDQDNLEPITPLSDLFARPSSVCATDENDRWPLEQPFGNFSLPDTP